MQELQSASPSVSFGNTILNVFASPSEAFRGLRSSPAKASLWVIPLLISFALVILFTYVIYSDEVLKSQVLDIQIRGMQKSVETGRITQAQLEQARSQMENTGFGLFFLFGGLPIAIFSVIAFFVAGLALWITGKSVLKIPLSYGKYLELYGVSVWIGILGSIVTLLTMAGLGSFFATPSAALLIYSSYDPFDNFHKVLAALDVFGIWQAVVIGFGLSAISGKPASNGIGLSMALWVLWALTKVGFSALFT